jgi:hypothetical protein
MAPNPTLKRWLTNFAPPAREIRTCCTNEIRSWDGAVFVYAIALPANPAVGLAGDRRAYTEF